MSPAVERSHHRGGRDLESGLEALRQSSEFRGPVEPPDDHEHPKDHLALIYESQEEQFATVIPFIRQGLEQGERCLYAVNENSREEVLEAMRTRGIDVDAALNSGALTIHTTQDTYLKDGAFDPDEMVAYLTDTISEALEEYEGFRATGEMTWILDDEPRLDEIMEYESKLTSLYSRENTIGLCQYNRDRFPPKILRDVISTHPHLIHNNVVAQNVYYTPPEEFLGPDQPAREIDRMLGTLQERAEAKTELADRQRFLHESYKITSNPEHSFEEKLEQLLELGREWFGLEMAALSELPSWDGKFRLEKSLGLGVDLEAKPFWTDPNEGCFCRQTITEDTPVSQVDVRETQWVDDTVYQKLGLTSYLGTKVMSGSTPYGTLWFGSTEPRERPFSDTERTFLELMGQWVNYEIERREHKQFQRELYEITADTERTFEEKLQAVFDLGCDRFDLDLGGIARIDPDTDLFEVETTSGEHDHLVPGEQYPLSETYCQLVTDEGETAGVTDPVSRGFDGKLCYERFGVQAYLGTHFGLEDGDGWTFFFLSNQPRETEFSEAEHTFHHLMGQWVKYELKNQQYAQELEETIDQLQQSNDRLKQFAYAASHDLREPLRMVSSYLQLLETRYENDLDEEAQEYIDFAVDGADRMREMVNDLLAYSRVEQSDGEFEPVDCGTVIERVRNDLQVQIKENDAEIAIESLPTVAAESEQLEQLFSNLVSNAIKYNDSESPRVDIAAEKRPDHWEFSIADNGIGIDPEKTDRIFEVFKRLHHDNEYQGTGIGLSLCQEIVDNHDGDIWVESEPGEGSTFYVTLPGTDAE